MNNEVVLQLNNIHKSFGTVKVLEDVSLEVKKGETHILIGENGAGKSTLMKILSGSYTRDSGDIVIDGENVDVKTPADSTNRGVCVIYQELSLIPQLTAPENIFLGRLPMKNKMVDWKLLKSEAKRIFELVNLEIDLDVPVRNFSMGQRQLIEIARCLTMDTKIIVMDEPTSSLTQQEVENLFKVIAWLKEKGISIIYISHKLEECLEIGDRVTVLKDGKLSGVANIADIDKNQLVKMMVGRDILDYFPPRTNRNLGKRLLEVKGLNRGKSVKDVSFYAKAGEILGFYGLVGAGRTETMRLIFGADTKDSGSVLIDGVEVNISNPKAAIDHKIALVSEDRRGEGLVMVASVRDNITLPNLKKTSKYGILDLAKEKKYVFDYINNLKIKTDDMYKKVVNLSGGNQQKVVIAKWLRTQANIFIFDEPTRGVDVGAKVEIYNIMVELAEQGAAVIMVTSEMPELLGVSDRILVMHEGSINAELMISEATEEKIMHYAAGGDN